MNIGAGAVHLSLATRIRIAQSRLDALRSGGGEYREDTRKRVIAQTESHLDYLWAEARLIARAI
jgi:hypothetical protein